MKPSLLLAYTGYALAVPVSDLGQDEGIVGRQLISQDPVPGIAGQENQLDQTAVAEADQAAQAAVANLASQAGRAGPFTDSASGIFAKTTVELNRTIWIQMAIISEAQNSIQGSTNPDLDDVAKTMATAFDNIAAYMQQAVVTVTSITTGAKGGILAGVTGMTQGQISEMVVGIQAVIDILTRYETGLTEGESIPAELADVIREKVNQGKQGVPLFLTPVVSFAMASRVANAATRDTRVLGDTIQLLFSTLRRLLTDLDLPIIGIGAIPGLPGVLGTPGVKIVL